ncbi:MAG: peptide deformylase [Desulfobacterales bacterium]|nr:peptide deformylase [Desulfobacterales bacterium]
MAIHPILQLGNPILEQSCAPIDFNRDDLPTLIRDLQDTLREFQRIKKIGRAIAAPQIGSLKRVVVMETPERQITMVNPEIRGKSRETFEVWDSCFSADAAFFGNTLRHCTVDINWRTPEGKAMDETFTGDLAELFQHEIDHLDGILFTDRILDNRIIMRSEWEKRFSME